MNKRKAAIVIPAHNRQITTERCLNHLIALNVVEWAEPIVVDDGSSDGTAEMLHQFGNLITVLEGSGQLWWGGGISLGTQLALDRAYEFVIWLNDDCVPLLGTLENLVAYAEEKKCVAVAVSETPSGYCYGGHTKRWNGLRLVAPNANQGITPCDTFGGNCVCFPRWVLEQAGLPDTRSFPHQLCDADYGLKVRRHNIPIVISGEWRCKNEDNFSPENRSWFLDVSLMEVWTAFFSKRSISYIPVRLRFIVRHWGLWGLILFCAPYSKFLVIAISRFLLPQSIVRKIIAGRSDSHRRFASTKSERAQNSK